MDGRKWSELPAAALKQIMLCTGCNGRHGRRSSHARVCKSWAEAAEAASVESVDLHKCADFDSLQLWLHKHGQLLKSFKANLQPPVGTFYTLRWPHLSDLQQLHLQHAELLLTGTNSISSVLAIATKLTSLGLISCRFSLHGPDPPVLAGAARPVRAPAAAVWDNLLAALPALTDLTELSLCDVFDALLLDVSQIGSMTKLQHLQLGGSPSINLHIAVSALKGLTNLRHFGLQYVTLYMHSRGARSDDGNDDAAQAVAVAGAAARAAAETAAAASVAALLSWLPELQHLTHLQLRNVIHLGVWFLNRELAPPSTAYRALTAPSSLQHIDLRGTAMEQSAWQRAFPAVRQHTSITTLSFGRNRPVDALIASEFAVRSCPNTCSIVIEDGTINGSEWGVLQHRTCLTSLSLGSPVRDDACKLALLMQLRQLRLPCNVDDNGLDIEPLTALTQLSVLGIADLENRLTKNMRTLGKRVKAVLDDMISASDLVLDMGADWDAMPPWVVASKAPEGSPPDVWSQLQAVCSRVDVLMAVPVRHHAL